MGPSSTKETTIHVRMFIVTTKFAVQKNCMKIT
jgi:hypothetical protein